LFSAFRKTLNSKHPPHTSSPRLRASALLNSIANWRSSSISSATSLVAEGLLLSSDAGFPCCLVVGGEILEGTAQALARGTDDTRLLVSGTDDFFSGIFHAEVEDLSDVELPPAV
jgi:hypothetical protein